MFKYFIISCSIILLSGQIWSQEVINEKPVAWWKFDTIDDCRTIDAVSGLQDSITGYFRLENGVSGKSLKLDGYTTKVLRKSKAFPSLNNGLTLEAWVALNSYPWNWTAIINQGGDTIKTVKNDNPAVNLNKLSAGLIGTQFGDPKVQRAQGKSELFTSDNDWTGGMNDWSARWRGYITAPFTGNVIFKANSDAGLQLLINDRYVIDSWTSKAERIGSITMVKGEKYPVVITYSHDGGNSFLKLFWSWSGQEIQIIPSDAFGYSERDNIMAREEIVPPSPPETNFSDRIFFGIDAYGHPGFRLNIEGKVYECISGEKLPLLKWNHVAATFSQNDGMKIFINGIAAGEFKIKGIISPEKGSDLLIGMNHARLGPTGSERQASANILSPMVIDGLLDEVKIYDIALSPEKLKKTFETGKPDKIQPLQWQKMPSGPAILPKKFDALYTRLMYTEEWESKWRVSENPDILIHFDLLPIRYIFWRGTGYGGAWVTENGIWMCDQSLERANEGKSPWGCSEHMSDKQTRYSSVRIVEKNDARIVLHWRYAVSDITYAIFGTDSGTGWGEWADEYYYIYPDGVSTRHQILYTNYLSHEWQETIVLNQAGTTPDDNIDLNAMSLANMKGEFKTYSWENGPPKAFPEPENINIQMVNLKSVYKPFIIFEPSPGIKPFKGSVRPGYSHFPWWNHWPVAQLANDGRMAFAPDRPSHSSLSQSVEASPVIHKLDDRSYSVITLVGMTDNPVSELAPLARSWNDPPEITLNSTGYEDKGYDKNQRAYKLSNMNKGIPSGLKMTLQANEKSPAINPAFVIENWGNADPKVEIDGKELKRNEFFRFGHEVKMQGSDLIIWLKIEEIKPVNITIKPIEK